MQVDWISAFCESPRFAQMGYKPYDTGRVLLLSPTGEIDRQSSRATTVQGSFDDRLLVQSRTGSDLYISGNPVKFIQGHNLYGPADPVALFFNAGWEVRKGIGLFPSNSTWEAGEFEGPRFTRIDLTRSYRFATAHQARTWLRDVACSARSRHKGNVPTDGTMYFGKNSSRWTLKCYHKGDEVQVRGKGHRLPDELPQRKELIEWADGVVRFEVTLRSKELEKLDMVSFDPLAIWQVYYDKVTWNQNARMVEVDMLEANLSWKLQATLAVWRQGTDPRLLMARNTFFVHRRELLKAIGVDIASPPPKHVAPTEVASPVLDAQGWDPQPLEGYAWNPDGQARLV
jgi:hypothetical protein